MNRIIFCFAALFFLVACSAPAVAPTATLVPQTLTSTPTQIQATETLVPTETATPVPTLNPEAWNQYGNVLVKNDNIAPYDKQLIVNPELEPKFTETVSELCYKILYLGALARQYEKLRLDSPPAPTGNLKDYETYKDVVINPAIEKGQTIEAWHLVGHTDSAKQPYLGMVESLTSVNPAYCSLKVGSRAKVYPNSTVMGGGLQIGVNTIVKEGMPITELNLNVVQTTKNNAGINYSNDKMTTEELALSYSQMLNSVSNLIDRVVTKIPTNSMFRDGFVSIFSKKSRVGFMFELPGISNLDEALKWIKESPNYFVSP